jgi:fluoroacetyl-CoA thioesterase
MRAPVSATHQLTHQVADADSAANWGNDLPVLATPVLLWLSELTAMRAVEQYLDEGEMTVGLAHDSSHRAPTPVGMRVRITATLVEHRGRKLVFAVQGHDDKDLVFDGRHTRAVVRRSEFVESVNTKAAALPGVLS